MNNKITENIFEIELLNILKILWTGRWKILIASMLGVLITLIFHFNKQKLNEINVHIKINKITPIFDILIINEIINKNELQNSNFKIIDTRLINNLLNYEFNDLEEVKTVVGKSKLILEESKNLDQSSKIDLIDTYSKNFNIKPIDVNSFHARFLWPDVNEGKALFNSIMQLVLENVKSSIIYDLEELSNYLEIKKKRKLESLKPKLNFLSQKFEILDNLTEDQKINVSTEYLVLREQVILLENDLSISEIRNSTNNVSKVNPNNWLKFDVDLANIKKEENFSTYFLIIFLAIFIGILYVIIPKFNHFFKMRDNS